MKGRAVRPDDGQQRARITSGATGPAGSLLRLTPAGDAARMWLSTSIALLALTIGAFVAGAPFRADDVLLAVNVFFGLFLMLTWVTMRRSAPADVERWALAQDPPRSRWRRFMDVLSNRKMFSGDAGMLAIQAVSAAGAAFALALLPWDGGQEQVGLRSLLCVLGVLLSWALLHVCYALYYAHLYYRGPGKPGGLEFPGEEQPAPMDFAYFAFTIGTTFATSDVSVSSSKVRRSVLVHSILAFFYNSTILALVVNLILTASR